MPPRDPPDDDMRLDEVVGRVGEALDELHVVDGAERDALLGSIREALASLGPVSIDGFEVRAVPAVDLPSGPPPVQLVEGGRDSDEPSTGPRPELRVAPEPEDTEESAVDGSAAPEPEPGRADPAPSVARSVSVLRIGGKVPRQPEVGVVRVPGGAWQSILAAQRPRAYRVGCTQGGLHVYVDGEPTCELGAGQSVDVEGAVLRVQGAADPGPSTGWYTRLGD